MSDLLDEFAAAAPDADISIPSYLTIDPVTGAISATFSGNVILTEGNANPNPPTTSQLQWQDAGGTVQSFIAGAFDTIVGKHELIFRTGTGGGVDMLYRDDGSLAVAGGVILTGSATLSFGANKNFSFTNPATGVIAAGSYAGSPGQAAGLNLGVGGFLTLSNTATNFVLYTTQPNGTDTQYLFGLTAAGTLWWGSGTATVDTALGRLAAGVLGDDSVALSTGPLSGSVTGAQTAGVILTAIGQVAIFDTVNTSAFFTAVTTDTSARFLLNTSGQMQWGVGTSPLDTTLARVAAGVLQLGTTAQAGRLATVSSATNVLSFSTSVTTDVAARWTVTGDGTLSWGGGALATDVSLARTVNLPGGTGSFLELTKGAGLGYGTGTGGAVTQATSRTTGVTINKPSGQITTSAVSLAAGAVATFVVTNSVVGAADFIGLQITNDAGIVITYRVVASAAGSFTISYTNTGGVATVTAYIFNFTVIKGAIA